MHSLKYSIK